MGNGLGQSTNTNFWSETPGNQVTVCKDTMQKLQAVRLKVARREAQHKEIVKCIPDRTNHEQCREPMHFDDRPTAMSTCSQSHCDDSDRMMMIATKMK